MDDIVYFYPEGHAAHYEPGHPERPERIQALMDALEAAGWWQPYPRLAPAALPDDLLRRVHAPAYLERLHAACRMGMHLDGDTYTTPASWGLALNAAGGSLAVARTVWQGEARRGFALARPPGHHATSTRGMGFCLLNNIAIAAEDLLSRPQGNHPNPRKLAIVDLDLHHGNGTQEIFWRRDDVLFISTHQSPLYPGSGALTETGSGPGEGFSANFPLPPFSGDEALRTVMDELILPLLDRYSPEMLLVSIGFDIHWRDPLGSLSVSAGGFHDLLARLVAWSETNAGGKIALFLEGGYDLDAGKSCGQAAAAALLCRPWTDPLGVSPHAETTAWKAVVRAAHSIWQL
jgi:acetoin utilization deacetylase AcuC-like enzyme